jgi:ATP-dependent exoDNAse (exonuclease V) beta subunit
VQAIGPDGAPIDQSDVDRKRAAETVIGVVRRLIRDEQVQPADLAILVPSQEDVDEVGVLLDEVGIAWRSARESKRGHVVVEMVARFKGLEAPVVIFMADWASARGETAYVAVSRARSRLYIIGSVIGTPLGDALKTCMNDQ